MSTEENKALIRRLVEDFNNHDLAILDELIDENYVDNDGFQGQLPGRDGIKQAHSIFFASFPDVHETIEDMIGEDDKVVVRWTCRGTHLGEYLGIPPSGRPIVVKGIDIYRIANGRVIEIWHNSEEINVLQQMGVDIMSMVGQTPPEVTT